MEQLQIITPNQLLSQAIDKGMELEHLERLMDLQERWEKNQAEKSFNKALNEFQANKPDLVKTNSVEFNGKHQFNFLPLPKIQKLIDPILSKFGISYSWKQNDADGKIQITCVVKHIDGHCEETHLTANSDKSGSKNEIQSLGSAVSYLKRYTLCNALGLSVDEDDDGQKSELTPEEIQELQKSKLVELMTELESELTEVETNRLNQIIQNNEVASYAKALKILKKKEELKK